MTAPAIEHVQAVAFDLDGTLCDSVPDLAAAANATRAHMGLPPLPQHIVESYVGDGLANLVHRVLTDKRDEAAPQNEWEQGFSFFIRYYRDHLSDFTRPYPETEAGLILLKTLGIPLVVITNKNEMLAVELLKQLGLADYFSLILGGDSLAEKAQPAAPLARGRSAQYQPGRHADGGRFGQRYSRRQSRRLPFRGRNLRLRRHAGIGAQPRHQARLANRQPAGNL